MARSFTAMLDRENDSGLDLLEKDLTQQDWDDCDDDTVKRARRLDSTTTCCLTCMVQAITQFPVFEKGKKSGRSLALEKLIGDYMRDPQWTSLAMT